MQITENFKDEKTRLLHVVNFTKTLQLYPHLFGGNSTLINYFELPGIIGNLNSV